MQSKYGKGCLVGYYSYFLSLGSNQGDREYFLTEGIKHIAQLKNLRVSKRSKVYETSPVNCVAGDPNFLNMVVECHSSIEPNIFLATLKTIENNFGRRSDKRNAPRNLDIDIIFIDKLILAENNLIVPHPECHVRLFVLKPFLDIFPSFIHPVLGESMQDLYDKLVKEKTDQKVYEWSASLQES